jgi:hypothetical protein
MRITAVLAAFLACLISTKSHAIDCPTLKKYVDQFGESFVESEAKARGYTDKQIAAVMKACSIKQK